MDDPHQPEIGIDVDDRTVRGARERDVRVALAVGVERVRQAVVVLLGHVDRRSRGERGHVEPAGPCSGLELGAQRRGKPSRPRRPT